MDCAPAGINSLVNKVRVGCIGGGQLGRMMALEAVKLNIEMYFLDPMGLSCPAAQVVPERQIVKGGLKDSEKLCELADKVDLLTVEIEHVGVESLQSIEDAGHLVLPSPNNIAIIQDKFKQKSYFRDRGIATPDFIKCESKAQIKHAASRFGLPLMLKSRMGSYDGKGNLVLSSLEDEVICQAIALLKPNMGRESLADLGLMAEKMVDFECEVAVIVVRSRDGSKHTSYDVVGTVQQNSVCRLVLAPAQNLSLEMKNRCKELAQQAVESLGQGAAGVFGVELFVTKEGEVLLNEIAPRPHNTGHFTQAACSVNQFENHLRAICGMPLGSTRMFTPVAAMLNILGHASGSFDQTIKIVDAASKVSGASIHWYGKESCRPGRKMGHINLVAWSQPELNKNLRKILEYDSFEFDCSGEGLEQTKFRVAVVMGSKSDLPTMNDAIEIIRAFDVEVFVDVVSAHRTPQKLVRFSQEAQKNGFHVIVAGAGGAAHLPGMIASMTPLPVIGVPVKTASLGGIDSLYSIVQMPKGVPVATMAIGNATNAGLLAIRMLASHSPELRDKMIAYQKAMEGRVEEMSFELNKLGSRKVVESMSSKSLSVDI